MSNENAPDHESVQAPDPAPIEPVVPEAPVAVGERKPIEVWAEAKKHAGRDAWKFEAAKTYGRLTHGWPEGAEVTEAEYDAAANDASNLPLGYAHSQR